MGKRSLRVWVAVMVSAAPMLAAAEGLSDIRSDTPWSQWRARIGLSLSGGTTADPAPLSTAHVQALHVLGDYYFLASGAAGAAPPSGLRATSGLLFGGGASGLVLPGHGGNGLLVQRGPLAMAGVDAAGDLSGAPSPYVGIGYSTTFLRNRWGLSADLGLITRAGGNAVRLGYAPSSGQNLADLLRNPQVSPILQLGVSYTF